MPPKAKYNSHISLISTLKTLEWKEIWSRFGFPNKTMGNNFILESCEIDVLKENISLEDKNTFERKKILIMDFLEDRRENIVEYIDYILQLKREANKKSSRIKQKDIIRKEVENELAVKAAEELERVQKLHREEMEKIRIEFEEKMAKLNNTHTNREVKEIKTVKEIKERSEIDSSKVLEKPLPEKKVQDIIGTAKINEKKKLLAERIKRKRVEYDKKTVELEQLSKEIEKLETELNSLS